MGKGFNNFMSKKGFHPGSYQNQKRIHEAEAKSAEKRKHDAETLAQYQREQELFQQRSLVSRESKEKLSLSFMYDPPPGTSSKNGDREDSDEEEVISKVKWSHKAKLENATTGEKQAEEEPKIRLKWKRVEKKSKNHLNRRPEVFEQDSLKNIQVKSELSTIQESKPDIKRLKIETIERPLR